MTGPPHEDDGPRRSPAARRHYGVALACGLFVLGMLGAAYASVPLYRMFCQATGYGGATTVATAAPKRVLDRTMRVMFDANIAPGLDVGFAPERPDVTVQVGAPTLIHYRVVNRTGADLPAVASYNVTPEVTGGYFSKIQCFCFNEIKLKAGEAADLPVVFFVDPAISDDASLDRVRTITLSYTLFAARQPERPVAEAARPPRL